MALSSTTLAGNTNMHTAGIYADMSVDGPEIGTLVVVVDRAKNLPNRRTMGKQDPYCAARLGKEAKRTETDRRGGQTPKWDQELRFTVHDSPDYYKLKVSLFSEDKRADLISEAWIPLNDVLLPGGGQSDLWHLLEYKGKYAGEIRMELTYYDTRPRAEKSSVSSSTRSRTLEGGSMESPVPSTQGPRDLPAVRRRPLPAHPNSSPAQLTTTNTAPTTPLPQMGPRSYHTPPGNNTPDSPMDSICQQQHDLQRFESHPESLTPSRPLPDPTQTQQPSNSAPLPYQTPTRRQLYQTPDHQAYEPQYSYEDCQAEPSFSNDPYAVQFVKSDHHTSPTTQQMPPLVRHDRVHALSGASQPKMQLAYEIPQAQSAPPYVQSNRSHVDDHALSLPQHSGPYQPPAQYVAVQHGQLSQSPPSIDSTYHDPSLSPSGNRYYGGPPPPTHRYSLPPDIREDSRATQHQVPNHMSRNMPESLLSNRFAPRVEEYAGQMAGRASQQPNLQDNPYDWQPAHVRSSTLPGRPIESYDGRSLQEQSTHEFERRRSDNAVECSRNTNMQQSTSDTYYNGPPGVHRENRNTVAVYSQSSQLAGYPFNGTATEDDFARQNFRNSLPPLKPQAHSPGLGPYQNSHSSPLIRKSVSPQTLPAQGPPQPLMPFSPDSYDQFNPRASQSPPSNNTSNTHSPSPLQTSQQPPKTLKQRSPLETLDGRILTPGGRIIDPSDHLPTNSWAPEPDRKNPAPATAKARLGPREARPPASRQRSSQQENFPTAVNPSGGRTRLQKRQPSGPLSPAEPNILNNSTNFSNPYPPPVPAKIPLYNTMSGVEDYEPGGKMTALSREMEAIDIGPRKSKAGKWEDEGMEMDVEGANSGPTKASQVIFGVKGGRARRSRFGA